MKIIEKIKNCLMAKMARKNVPTHIADKAASWYVDNHLTVHDISDIETKKMQINYNEFEFEKVKIETPTLCNNRKLELVPKLSIMDHVIKSCHDYDNN